jgi:hypothetical protein
MSEEKTKRLELIYQDAATNLRFLKQQEWVITRLRAYCLRCARRPCHANDLQMPVSRRCRSDCRFRCSNSPSVHWLNAKVPRSH